MKASVTTRIGLAMNRAKPPSAVCACRQTNLCNSPTTATTTNSSTEWSICHRVKNRNTRPGFVLDLVRVRETFKPW
ncbi:MAG: hypothetical protein MI923_15785 [Phycisphaerales bacterium]|nr:hypothetical protein [Phycisphaerales bacterium]